MGYASTRQDWAPEMNGPSFQMAFIFFALFLRLAGEVDSLSTHSRPHSQTMLLLLACITSVSSSLQISIQANGGSLLA
jgi:hypothetical protein